MLVDSHCHLDFPDFADDFADVLARARAAGVETMLTICTHLSRFERVRAIAEAHPPIYCSVGIHPHEAAREAMPSMADLVALADHPKVVGFGETGLDFHYMHSPRPQQELSFRTHIAAAREAGLPVIIHSREAEAETAAIIEEEMEKGAFPALIHCFSGSPASAKQMLALGCSLSFSGIATFRKAEGLRQAAAETPLDRILVETDAPYLAPAPHRGKRNEPAFVSLTAAAIAAAKGLELQAFAAATTANFHKLFTKAERP